MTVRSCEERKVAVHGYLDANKQPVIVRESAGWFLTLDPGGLTLGIGAEAPGFVAGQAARLTIETTD